MTQALKLQKAVVRTLNTLKTVYATRRITSGGQGHKAFALKLFAAGDDGQAFTLAINKKNPDLPKFLSLVEEFNKRRQPYQQCKVVYIGEPVK